jgi:hypothetical protein
MSAEVCDCEIVNVQGLGMVIEPSDSVVKFLILLFEPDRAPLKR